MPLHRVCAGECLLRIAAKYHFDTPETIWNYPGNASLKRHRSDPNILHPGDILCIPEKRDKQEVRSTGQTHVFRVQRKVKTLHIALENEEGVRLVNAPYLLRIESSIYRGRTDGQGLLKQEIPIEAEEGDLSMEGHTWPLKIGHLNPVEETPDDGVSGIKARLHNLGYNPGPVETPLDATARTAICAFQRDNGLPEDGMCARNSATLAKLCAKHGC